MISRIKRRIKTHPLIETFSKLEGNPKVCLWTEPLWGIPAALYTPYMSVYMAALGLSDLMIGQVIAVGLFFQVLTSLLGGVLTDRLGRRLTTFIFDTFSWSVPVLLWMLADSYEVFIAASIANAFFQITANSWTNLMVEDAPKEELVNMFTWTTLAGLLSVFFAPIAGALIKRLGLVTGMRVIFAFTFVMMTSKFVLTWIFTEETEIGKRRREALRGTSIRSQLKDYGPVLRRMFKNKNIIFILLLMVMVQIGITINNNFFSLYTTKNLGIPERFLSYFPMLRAGIMLILIFTIQTRLNRLPFKIPLASGLLLYIAAQLILIFSPYQSLPFVFLYTAAEALAYALVIPQRDALLNTFIDQDERARELSLMNALMVALSAPFGYISGRLSSLDRRYPFVLNMACYLLCLLLLLRQKQSAERTPEKR